MPGAKSSTTTNSQSSTQPGFAPQVAGLTTAFNDARKAYGTASGAAAPTDFTAGLTPDQLATFHQMVGFGGNLASANAETGAGSNLLGAGADAAGGALDRLGAFNPSSTNNMDAITSGANKFVQGVDIPGQVKQAMQGAVETARDVTNPQIDNNAASTGNTNSSRTGLAQGLVDRALAEQGGNLGATLTNEAYNTGAGLAANQSSQNTSENLNAIEAALTGGTSLASTGGALASSGIDNAGKLFDIAGAGGAGEQSGNQDALTNELQQYESKVSSPYDALQGLMSIIGTNNWGTSSTGTSTATQTPSAFQVIGGLMNSAGSFLSPFKLSDRDYKEDIAVIGKLFDGTPVYRYRYKGSPRFEIGLMAQDVEKTNPDAVRSVEGVKFVNYDDATRHLVH
jgi:hypothetical protein